MKATCDVPENELSGAKFHASAETRRAAEATAATEHDRRQRMLNLVQYAGTCTGLPSADELQAQRRRG